jgi:hypothetical protein
MRAIFERVAPLISALVSLIALALAGGAGLRGL